MARGDMVLESKVSDSRRRLFPRGVAGLCDVLSDTKAVLNRGELWSCGVEYARGPSRAGMLLPA